jgi:glycosyltransferase involved in cell wall biosynthesis
MDLVLTSSNHSKKVFSNTKYDAINEQTQQKIGTVELKKPIEVLIEGANLDVYKPKKSTFDLSNVKEDFAFLFVGHWMHGNLGHDRKNVGVLVQTFLEAFKNKKKTPALILKTTITGGSYMDRDEILKRIDFIRNSIPDAKTLPNIYLVHGNLSDKEMNELYTHKKVKAMVNLTKGEGFGRPLLEFSLTNNPIITTNWSGHVDFLSPEFTTLLPGQLHNLDDSSVVENMLMKEFQWFGVDPQSAYTALRDMFTNYKDYKERAIKQGSRSRSEFSFDKMVNQLGGYIDQYVPEFPKPIKLKLPNINKISLPKPKKLEHVEG